jgi:hypothetical protein
LGKGFNALAILGGGFNALAILGKGLNALTIRGEGYNAQTISCSSNHQIRGESTPLFRYSVQTPVLCVYIFAVGRGMGVQVERGVDLVGSGFQRGESVAWSW